MRKTSIFHFVFISGREALIWFIIMKLNSRYLFPSVKHLRRHSLIQTEETNMYKGAKRAFSRRLSSLVKSSQQDPPHIRATHGPDLFQSQLIPSAGQKKGRQHFNTSYFWAFQTPFKIAADKPYRNIYYALNIEVVHKWSWPICWEKLYLDMVMVGI